MAGPGDRRGSLEIERYGPIIAAAEKELTIAEVHLETVQRILKEAIQPGEVDVIPAPNEFNQAIGRTSAL
ncbi:MAG: hypothetical protein WCW68_13940 [Methanothrix sp.]|jgi:hypothetical protein